LLRGSNKETGVIDFGKTCYGEVANLLQTSYGESDVMYYGLKQATLVLWYPSTHHY